MVSCVVSKPTIIVGNYNLNDKISCTNLTLEGGYTFRYNFTSEGFGHKEWSHGSWKKVTDDRIHLSSIAHDKIPIKVNEDIRDVDQKIIILQPTIADWDVNTIVRVNGEPISLPKKQHILFLSTLDFPEINTISLEATIDGNNFLREFVNYYEIKSEVYKTKQGNSNVFFLMFTHQDFYSYFYLKEIDTDIVINRKGVLFWNNQKYRK